MAPPQKPCTFKDGGPCFERQTACAYLDPEDATKGCDKCSRHCRCSQELPASTPVARQYRSSQNDTLAGIRACLNAQTPLLIRQHDANYCKWKDFCALVPPRKASLPFLRDDLLLSPATDLSLLKRFDTYACDLLRKLVEVVTQPWERKEVQDLFFPRLSARLEPNLIHQQRCVEVVRRMFVYLKQKNKRQGQSRYLLPFLTPVLSDADVDMIQTDVDPENRLTLGRTARKTGKKEYAKLTGADNADNDESVHSSGETNEDFFVNASRIPDELIKELVAFIVDNCQVNSWGSKLVPLGGGEGSVVIPSLTRKCNPQDMWKKYEQSKEEEKVRYTQILGFTGPWLAGQTEYNGSAYNLMVKWDDGEETSEPLASFGLDDPVSCALFAMEKGLLEEQRKGWIGFAKYLKKDGTPVSKDPTFLAHRGGRQRVGRSTLFYLVKHLTAGNEKLISSVDYVKGVLVHDSVDTLQRIIDELVISSRKEKEELTRCLSILSNFLKNQYKNHIFREDECDTHGVLNALSVPESLSERTPHYSKLTPEEVDKLIAERGIKLSKKGQKTTLKRRIEALDEWGHQQCQKEQNKEKSIEKISSHTDGTAPDIVDESNSVMSTGSCECFEEFGDSELDVKLRLLDGLQSMSELRSEIAKQGLQTKSNKKAVLRDALREHYHSSCSNTAAVEAVVPPRSVLSSSENAESEVEKIGGHEHVLMEITDGVQGLSLLSDHGGDISVSVNEDEDEEQDHVDSDNASGCRQVSPCSACSFLHYFMLERLPNALLSERSIEGANVESIDNALEYIQDAHEKFMLYQAHVVRATNQSKCLTEMDAYLSERCIAEKNLSPLHLWLTIDFKMKWEPMYQREKTLENYSKRGISWHGNRVHFYIWDEKMEQPVKKVIKIDQILDGTNKQDGLTVLALLEAVLIYLKREFPGADVEFMQSDNAACYHLKDLVLAIPMLNALMKKTGGPVVKNFVHTETQDGKSLLDAHFAHSTALLKRSLRRSRQNRLNKLSSASELFEGLCDRGGLQNCGAQRVKFDPAVASRAREISALLGRLPEKMKKFFSRANEINYFPAQDSEDGLLFEIHVKAYSAVGDGARFKVNIDTQTVDVVFSCANDIPTGEDDEECPAGFRNEDDTAIPSMQADHEEEEDNNDDNFLSLEEGDTVEELLNESTVNSDEEAERQGKLRESTNGIEDYNSTKRFTHVKVEEFMPLGNILTSKESKTQAQRQAILRRPFLRPRRVIQKTILARAAYIFSNEAFSTHGIQDGTDEDVPEYRLAESFQISDKFIRRRGWARRPKSGAMYGKKYLPRFKKEAWLFYKRGEGDSSQKLGPSAMQSELMATFPGIYTLPSFAELQSFVSQCFAKQKQKKAGEGSFEDLFEMQVTESNSSSSLESTYSEAVDLIIEKYGGEILPSYVFGLLKYSCNDVDGGLQNNKKRIMDYAKKKISELKNQRMRSLIG